MRKFVTTCVAFGALALLALWSSPAHADPMTDPATGITIDLGPNIVQHGETAPIYVVYYWCDQQGAYVQYSWYQGMMANVYAQNDSDQLNAQGFYTHIAVYVEDAPGG